MNGPEPRTPLPARPAPVPDFSASAPEAAAPRWSTSAFKTVVERIADEAKKEVVSTGAVSPAAIFVYQSEAGAPEVATTKTVSLAWRDELQKEALTRRIREKALAENASAVVVLAEAEGERPGTVILSGAAPGMRASARVTYAFDKSTKTITSWETRWLDSPLQNAFLDGIFDTTS